MADGRGERKRRRQFPLERKVQQLSLNGDGPAVDGSSPTLSALSRLLDSRLNDGGEGGGRDSNTNVAAAPLSQLSCVLVLRAGETELYHCGHSNG
jgi:hypothetical protein